MSFFFLMICFGVPMLIFGLSIRLGHFKTWYLTKGVPILIPRAAQNMLIPLGCTFLVLGVIGSNFVADIDTRQKLFITIICPMLLISFIVTAWGPRWLRPRWLVYLEDIYGSVMWHLLEEARKDPWRWEQRVLTQKGLEEWAEETYLHLGYPPRLGQIEREAKKRRCQL